MKKEDVANIFYPAMTQANDIIERNARQLAQRGYSVRYLPNNGIEVILAGEGDSDTRIVHSLSVDIIPSKKIVNWTFS